MPTLPLHPCRAAGCFTLTEQSYCPQHQKPRRDERSDEAKRWHRWYSLDIWTKELRPQQLVQEPWCEECAKQGRRVRATDVDHRREHRGDWENSRRQRNFTRRICSLPSRTDGRENSQERSYRRFAAQR